LDVKRILIKLAGIFIIQTQNLTKKKMNPPRTVAPLRIKIPNFKMQLEGLSMFIKGCFCCARVEEPVEDDEILTQK
jgi:hypothetical protein